MSFTTADLTIALPTIGRPGYLQAAIESLLATTPDDVSFLLVLNGCPPETRPSIEPLVERWPGPVEVVELADRVPLDESHNTALRLCTTPLVSFMGDDDVVIEPRLERMVSLFDLEPTPLVVSSFAKRTGGTADEPVFAGNKDLGATTIAEWERRRDRGELFELCFPSAIFRTDAVRAIGGFEGKFGSTIDVAVFSRLSRQGPVITDPKRSFGYRIHDGSVSTADGAKLAELLRYVGVCIGAMDAGEPEPTFDQFQAAEAAQPVARRFARRRRVAAQVRFRRAGAAMLRGDRVDGARHLAVSALSSPTVFARKVIDQLGRPGAAHVMPPVKRPTPDWVADVSVAVAALPPDAPTATVLIKGLHDYRVTFYEHLRRLLAERGIRFRLVHGQGSTQDRAKGGNSRLTWSEPLPVHTLELGTNDVLWQNGLSVARSSDLVICEQASRLLLNYVLLAAQPIFGFRLALTGHGKNLRSDSVASGEAVKRWLTRRVHWFFAYNRTGVSYVEQLGFPPERITSVGNTVDTRELRDALAAVGPADVTAARDELGIRGHNIGIYMGGLYDSKRPQFLVEAALHIRRLVPDFELIIVGQGPDELVAKEAASQHPWIHYPGAVFGPERVRFGAAADIFLLTGAAGLSIVDAFAMELPVVAVDLPTNAPEIEYLVDGRNGVLLGEDVDPERYAAEVARLLTDDAERGRLASGAAASASDLTVERMAERFADGIVAALEA
jgi:glycosyltransferase involved in cell wall biosynthesis